MSCRVRARLHSCHHHLVASRLTGQCLREPDNVPQLGERPSSPALGLHSSSRSWCLTQEESRHAQRTPPFMTNRPLDNILCEFHCINRFDHSSRTQGRSSRACHAYVVDDTEKEARTAVEGHDGHKAQNIRITYYKIILVPRRQLQSLQRILR